MKNTPLILRFFFAVLTLVSSTVLAQSYRSWSKPEQQLAEILIRDTVSRTVSYLPKGYWFGLTDRSYGYLKLVKNGANNYLLRDGTHQVYLLRKSQDDILLDRQDSSVFSGDNFLSIAFLRKDTIYQYGGYGFWNTRDFFMRYRPENRDWEFVPGVNGLPNELNYHWYDDVDDALYIIGSLYSCHRPTPKKILVDSVYKYDFSTHKWVSTGRLIENFSELNIFGKINLPVCFTPFGFLDTRTFQLKLYDIPGNRLLAPKGRLTDFLFRIAKGNPLQINEYMLFIYLKDNLHIIQGNKDTAFHASIQVTETDFDASNPQVLFVPNKNGFSIGFSSYLKWLFALVVPFSIAGYFWKAGRRRKKEIKDFSDEDSADTGQEDDSHETDQPIRSMATIGEVSPQDLTFFMAQLNPTELALLDMLLHVTREGSSADISTINKTLGVLNKEASLQKARRSISINNINSCFRQIMKIEENLIIRERNDDDKRAFVYKLNPAYIDRFSS
jgi:hypothetical protein